MENIGLLIACLAIGTVLRFSGRLPENTPAALNGFVIHVSLPALIILHLHKFPLDGNSIYPIAAPWLLFAGGFIFFVAASAFWRWTRQTTGALILTGGLANTSFVGVPLIEVFYGAQFISVGLLIDTLGTYLVLSTLGLLVAAACSMEGGRLTISHVARRILLFPPFIALVAAIALQSTGLPATVEAGLEKLGSTLAPIALVSVGYQLRLSAISRVGHLLATGLAYNLVFGPLLVWFILIRLFELSGPVPQITVFETAMAPQIGAAIVAIEHKLNPDLVTLMVGIGIPLSFITVTAWWYFLN